MRMKWGVGKFGRIAQFYLFIFPNKIKGERRTLTTDLIFHLFFIIIVEMLNFSLSFSIQNLLRKLAKIPCTRSQPQGDLFTTFLWFESEPSCFPPMNRHLSLLYHKLDPSQIDIFPSHIVNSIPPESTWSKSFISFGWSITMPILVLLL